MALLQNLLGRKKTGANYAIALDIGTEVVKALIFRIDSEEGKGIVVGVGRAQQKPGHMTSGAVSDIAGVITTCQQAIDRAAQKLDALPEQCIMGIAGELVKGTTVTVRYERLRPQLKIDMPELKNIVQKVQWKAFDRVRQQLSWETGHSEIDIKLINASIVDVRIDGYRVTNPLGFQGKEVSISVFNSYAPLIHLGALQTIANELDLDLLSIAAEPYAVARSLGTESAIEFSAIFIDVGGGTTDIAVVRNGGIEGTKMFALGGRAFTKRLSTELGISFEEAEKLKLKYSFGELGAHLMNRVRQILEDDCKVWLSGIELALGEFSSSDLMPNRILLCGGGAHLPEIKKVLSSNKWPEDLPFSNSIKVDFINPSDVINIVDKTSQLNDPQDITPMGLSNLALEFVGEERVLGSILRKVVRMMQN